MTASGLTFHFAAPVLRLETGLKQHYIPVPPDIAEAYHAHHVRRLIAHKLKTHTLYGDLHPDR